MKSDIHTSLSIKSNSCLFAACLFFWIKHGVMTNPWNTDCTIRVGWQIFFFFFCLLLTGQCSLHCFCFVTCLLIIWNIYIQYILVSVVNLLLHYTQIKIWLMGSPLRWPGFQIPLTVCLPDCCDNCFQMITPTFQFIWLHLVLYQTAQLSLTLWWLKTCSAKLL